MRVNKHVLKHSTIGFAFLVKRYIKYFIMIMNMVLPKGIIWP